MGFNRKHTEETKKKISEALSLEKHPQWKHNNIKRPRVLIKLLKRAGINVEYCSGCKKKISGIKRQVHHVDKDRKNNSVCNLRICCIPCHRRLDGYGFYTDYAKKHKISVSRAWELFNMSDGLRERKRLANKKHYEKNKTKLKKKAREYCLKKRLMRKCK